MLFSSEHLYPGKEKGICSPEKVPQRSKLASLWFFPPSIMDFKKNTVLHTSWIPEKAVDKFALVCLSLGIQHLEASKSQSDCSKGQNHISLTAYLEVFKSLWISTTSFALHLQFSSAEGAPTPPRHVQPCLHCSACQRWHGGSGNLVQEDTFLSSRCSHTYCGPITITGMIGLCFCFNELEDPWTSLASFHQISVSVCFEAVTSPSCTVAHISSNSLEVCLREACGPCY